MAYRWKPDKSSRSNLRRLTTNQLRSAIDQLNDRLVERTDAVHEARLHLKKARSLLRLARPAVEDRYAQENARLRDVAHQLSRQRDAQAIVEAADKLARHAEQEWGCSDDPLTMLRALRDQLAGRQAAEDDGMLDRRMPELTETLGAAAEDVERWASRADEDGTIVAGFASSYRRARRALRAVLRGPTAENLHEWRKESKYHRYQVRLFQDAWPELLEVQYEQLKRLSDLLGDDHDLVVLRERVGDAPPAGLDEAAVDEIQRLVERRRQELQAEAIPLGRLLYAEKPKQIARRFQEYWRVHAERFDS